MADYRRLFRFSLKTLLVVMTVLAVWLGLYAKRLRDRREAILAIEQMGATLGVKTSGPVWLRPVFRDERYFWDVGGVHFRATRHLTDEELQQLMKLLAGFDGVKQLQLPGSHVTDEGLANLRPLSGTLIVLDIRDTAISDAGVQYIKPLTALKDVHVRGSAISEVGLSDLQQALPNCTINR